MAAIRDGNGGTDQLSIDPVSKAARTTLYKTDGTVLTPTTPTDVQPVSGTVSVSNLPSDLATETTLEGIKTQTDQLSFVGGSKLKTTATTPTDTQPISAISLPLPSGAATSANQQTDALTDTELRASPVSISGTISAIGPLTDTQLRAAAVPVSAVSLPLPPGAATETGHLATIDSNLALIKTKTDNIDVLLSTRTKPADSQHVTIDNSAVEITNDLGNPVPVSGTVTATGPLTDTQLRASAVPISASSLPLPSGAATSVLQTQPGVDIGDVTINNTGGANAVNIQDGGNSITVDGIVTAKQNDAQTLLGVYYYHGGANLVQASADAATAGRFWVINPIGSGVTVRIKSIEFASQLGSALAAPTSPRITIERVTFTGTASGATLAPAKRKTGDASSQSSLRTASTGLSLTAGNVVVSFLPVASATAVGYTNTAVEKWRPDTDDRIELAPGEGIVCRQPDAGTTADTRRFTVDITIEEF